MQSETKYTKQDLETMRAWSLQRKIQVTQTRIIEWIGRYDWNVYISFSGGKDSTVLADLTARAYQAFWCPNRKEPLHLVFVNTGLEYPEIQKFVKYFAKWLERQYEIPVDLKVLTPELTFPEVLTKYGYPVIGKEVAKVILDDVAYQDAPTTLQVGGVSKPSDTDFSELERETIWKNTSIKRIGESIAGRYGLGFTYDADDYDIECDEQDGTDSSYYNTLCKNYGLILKVYAKRLWVYDRERYKGKRAVQDFDRTNIIPGSLSYNTTLSGTYTGGYFTYTDADKDLDIVCSVGGGNHTKNVNRRATSVYDASVQLCAEINNANHGRVKLKFSVMGNWGVSAGNNLRLTGYGDGLNGGINGKYFVDKVTHKYTKSGGFVTSFECSGIFDPFHYWDVGGHIEYHQSEDSSSESYNSAYETTSQAANAASAAAGATAGAAVTLTKAPFYYTSVAPKPSCYKSGTFYFYDGILVNNRYRITNTAARCGKLPVGKNVTGWVPASYCNGGGITTK